MVPGRGAGVLMVLLVRDEVGNGRERTRAITSR